MTPSVQNLTIWNVSIPQSDLMLHFDSKRDGMRKNYYENWHVVRFSIQEVTPPRLLIQNVSIWVKIFKDVFFSKQLVNAKVDDLNGVKSVKMLSIEREKLFESRRFFRSLQNLPQCVFVIKIWRNVETLYQNLRFIFCSFSLNDRC